MTDFNSVLLKAISKAKEKNYSALDTVSLVTDYMDIAGIPIPGAPPVVNIQPTVTAIGSSPVTPIGSSLPTTLIGASAFLDTVSLKPDFADKFVSSFSIESPIHIQIKTLDELYDDIQKAVPDTMSIVIPGFESAPPRKYKVEVGKVNSDPKAPGFVRIRFTLYSDRSNCESQVIYYAEDTVDVQKDLQEFENLVKNKYRNRDGKIQSTFNPIQAIPSMFDDKNAVHLGNIT